MGLCWIISHSQTLRDCEVSTQQDQSNSGDSLPATITHCIEKLHNEFETSMSDDLHTTVAIAAVSEPLKVMNDLLHTRKV
jgi:cysteinyl-tRNA synthetase